MGIEKGMNVNALCRQAGKGSTLIVSFVAIIAIVALVILMYNFMSTKDTTQQPSINVELPKAPDNIGVPAPEMPKVPSE